MGIEYEGDKLDEILRLTKENNRMLHAQRRNAVVGGILKLVLWVVLFLVPLYLYLQYVAPMMQSMLETYQEIQGTSAQAQAQFGQLTNYFEKVKSLYGGE